MKEIKAMIKFFKAVSICLVVVVLLSSCAEEQIPGTTIAVSPENENVHQLVSRVYTDDELEELSNKRFQSVESLNNSYPIECVRASNWHNTSGQLVQNYSVIYCSANKYVFVGIHYLDSELDGKLTPSGPFDARYDLAWFEEKLVIGMPLEVVETEVDPYGYYPIHNVSDCSIHKTSDGYSIVITYSMDSGPVDAVVSHVEINLI